MIRGSDRFGVAIAGVLLAAGLMYIAVPQGLSAVAALSAMREAKTLSTGVRQSPEDLRKLAASRARALDWAANPLYARELSGAYHTMIGWVAPENQQSLIAATRDAAVAELRMRPLNGIAWWRLGVMEAGRAGAATRQSARYLMRSVDVQPNAMTLMPRRLSNIIYNWWLFDMEESPAMHGQILQTWRIFPDRVVQLAENEDYRDVIRGALAIDPMAADAFDKASQKKKN